jgi:hypothetical protein
MTISPVESEKVSWGRIAERFRKERSVVETALEDDQPWLIAAVLHSVNEAVFLSNPARPLPFELIAQRLRLTDALEGVTQYVPDQLVDPTDQFGIGLLPGNILAPALRLPDEQVGFP